MVCEKVGVRFFVGTHVGLVDGAVQKETRPLLEVLL